MPGVFALSMVALLVGLTYLTITARRGNVGKAGRDGPSTRAVPANSLGYTNEWPSRLTTNKALYGK